MRHHDDITWRQESATSWTCLASGASVATIVLRSQYELESSDAQVHGSHTSLASAESQFDAWRSWAAARDAGE